MSEPQSRRQFLHGAARTGLSAAGLALLGGCAVSPGQGRGGVPGARVVTIGFLPGGTEEGVRDEGAADETARVNELRQGLRELGWVEGENLRLEVREAQGDFAAWPDLAAELVRIPVDLIVTQGIRAALAAAAATRTLPVVMVYGPPDPVERGLVASIQRPGGNVTGNVQPPYEIYGKRLELLVEAVPHVARVAYLGPGTRAIVESLGATARALRVQLHILSPQSEPALELAFEAIGKEAADALLVASYETTNGHLARIVDFAAQRRLPAMYAQGLYTVAGGLMSYDLNRAALHRRATAYVDRILRGARPGDLPLEYPTEYGLVINLKTAEALGLTIPEAVLAQAAEVLR